MLLYVNDNLLFMNNSGMLALTKQHLMENFDMHDLGELEFIVGIHVTRDRECKKIYLDQTAHTERVLKKFAFDNAKTVCTRMILMIQISHIVVSLEV